MVARTSDGEKLGKVARIEQDHLVIEKGLFFKTEYVAGDDQIDDLRDDEVWLHRSKDELASYSVTGGAQRPAETEERRIPLAEEELTAEKRTREAGRVEVRKDVVTEQRELTVPVMKEEVHVERVPASGTTAEAQGATFEKETLSVPVREEEVEIRKRPVIREELRVRKERGMEERRASETVRKEVADVDEEGRRSPSMGEGDEPTRS